MTQSRRSFLETSALTLTALASGASLGRALHAQAPAGGPQAPPAVTPVFTAIRRNVGFFTGRGGTIGYLIAPTGIVVVDSQFPDSAALCLTGINERSKSRPIDMLINTHHHGDHTGGNIAFRGATKRVISHARAAELMKQPGRQGTVPDNYFPTETFTDVWRATVGDETMRARHYGSAHTGGDAVITFERANVAHMGDLMFNGRHPVVDRPSGASLRSWITVLERTVADHNSDTTYIFGHSGPNLPVTGGNADLMKMRDYLTAVLDHVRGEMRGGKTKEQLAAAPTPLKGFEGHGPLTAAVLNAAFDELSAG